MPDKIDNRSRVTFRGGTSPGSYAVQKGDSLYAIAKKVLGDGDRWPEIQKLNNLKDPGQIQVGQVLKMPEKTAEAAAAPSSQSVSPTISADHFDGEIDSKGNWSMKLANEFGAYVNQHSQELQSQGVEVDCSDLAAKLLSDFCKDKGIRNPLGVISKECIYTPQNPGGLPNVNGPNVVFPDVNADELAKDWTKDVNDANGNGVSGANLTGKVDVADLRAGDILFYDWDGDGKVNHTVNVVKVDPKDKAVTIAYGTYDNLKPDGNPVTWDNLDLQPIRYLELKPGTEDYQKWLGSDNSIWGVRRYSFLPDKPDFKESPVVAQPQVSPQPDPSKEEPSAVESPSQTEVKQPVVSSTPPTVAPPKAEAMKSPLQTPPVQPQKGKNNPFLDFFKAVLPF